jgi:hypothetical protein
MIVVPSANFIFSDEVHRVSAPNDLCPGLNASIVWLVLDILLGYLTFSNNFEFIFDRQNYVYFGDFLPIFFYQFILMTLRDAYHKGRACHKRSILDISAEWRTVVYQMMSCTASWPQDAVL